MPTIPPYFQKEIQPTSRPDQDPSLPSASAIPRANQNNSPQPSDQQPTSSSSSTKAPLPIRRHKYPVPKLRIHLNELTHEGSSIFLSNVKGGEDIETQVQNVLNLLYGSDHEGRPRPGTRSVTFVLRPMDGVAYTTGSDLDSDHKEIHVNLNYIRQVAHGKRQEHTRDEILGVICHELVHCFQWNALGTCPGGLIEGIADWVRLRAGLGAAHWKREPSGDDWDAGYQTTGFFLDWLEEKYGEGTVRLINAELRALRYDEDRIFGKACKGMHVEDLWLMYQEELQKGGNEETETEPEQREQRAEGVAEAESDTRGSHWAYV